MYAPPVWERESLGQPNNRTDNSEKYKKQNPSREWEKKILLNTKNKQNTTRQILCVCSVLGMYNPPWFLKGSRKFLFSKKLSKIQFTLTCSPIKENFITILRYGVRKICLGNEIQMARICSTDSLRQHNNRKPPKTEISFCLNKIQSIRYIILLTKAVTASINSCSAAKRIQKTIQTNRI